jgi:hypothetical protein
MASIIQSRPFIHHSIQNEYHPADLIRVMPDDRNIHAHGMGILPCLLPQVFLPLALPYLAPCLALLP